MSWFQEVKPSFLVARAYGVAPYLFDKSGPSNSRTIRILSAIILTYRICECSFRVYRNVITQSNLPFKILLVTQSVLRSSSFIVEGFVCIRSTKNLEISIKHIENYDKALGVDFAATSVELRAWLKIAVAACYLGFLWILRAADSRSEYIMNLYNTISGIGWFAMAFKFLGVVSSLNRRFQHLCNILTKDASCTVYEDNGSRRSFHLEDVCRLHGHLISAAREFNSMHNMVLLIWIFESSVFTTVKLYTFFNDNKSDSYDKSWHTCFYVMPDLIFLIYLFIRCHNTAAVANKIGWVALSPKSCVLRGRLVNQKDEGFIIGQSFVLHHLHFTAAYGLFRVELPLLGTIFGAITTVLVTACN